MYGLRGLRLCLSQKRDQDQNGRSGSGGDLLQYRPGSRSDQSLQRRLHRLRDLREELSCRRRFH